MTQLTILRGTTIDTSETGLVSLTLDGASYLAFIKNEGDCKKRGRG